jgi:hypothetical protein
MYLKGGNRVKYDKFKMRGELWIPASSDLQMDSKYSVIELEDLKGGAVLDLYNDKLYARSMGDDLKVMAKYGRLEFTELENFKADLYNVELDAASAKEVNIVSNIQRSTLPARGT